MGELQYAQRSGATHDSCVETVWQLLRGGAEVWAIEGWQQDIMA